MESKLVPYEVIEKAIGGDTASLLTVQAHYKPHIAYLSHGDTELKDLLNAKLLEAVLKFKVDYQSPEKSQSQEKPVFMGFTEAKIRAVRVLYSSPQK